MPDEVVKLTGPDGQADALYEAPAVGGTAIVTATIAGVATATTFTIQVVGDALSIVSDGGATPSAVEGLDATLTVRLVDKDGAAKGGEVINFAITGGGAGSLSAASATTDNTTGEASVVYTADATGAGTSVTVEASGATVMPLTFTIGVTEPPKDVLTVLSGLTPRLVVGQELPINIRLADIADAAKDGVTINFALTGAGSFSDTATETAATATTDASGNASVTYYSTGAVADTQVTIAVSGDNFDSETITVSLLSSAITLASLLGDMVNRERVAQTPIFDYSLKGVSSADPRSFDADAATADIPCGTAFGGVNYSIKKENANADWNHFFGTSDDIRTEPLIRRNTTTNVDEAQAGQIQHVKTYTYMNEPGPGVLTWFHWQSIQNWTNQNNLQVDIYLDDEADKELAAAGTGAAVVSGSLTYVIGGETLVPRPLSEHSGGPLLDYDSVTGDWSIADTSRYNALMEGPLQPEVPFTNQMSRAVQCKSHNFYFPIPYQTRLLVQLTGVLNTPGQNYVNQHPDGATYSNTDDDRTWWCMERAQFTGVPVDVEAYTPALRDANEALIKSTAEALLAMTSTGVTVDATDTTTLAGAILPAGEKVLNLTGPSSIRRLKFKLSADDLSQALRSTILEITFDGAATPQVKAPIGHFFGTGEKISPCQTWNLKTERDGTMTAVFVMPFGASAQIKVINLGVQTVTVETGEVSSAAFPWDPATSKHFYAQWKEYTRLETSPEQFLDVVDITGDGYFLGLSMSLFNAPQGFQTTDGWWGEGECWMFVDGESIPSIYDSGTEERYKYNLSRHNWFEGPQGAQARGDGNSFDPGHVVNTWFSILTPPRFLTSFSFKQEFWHWDKKKAHNPATSSITDTSTVAESRVSYAFCPYWYASPGSTFTNIAFDENVAKYAVIHTKDQLYAGAVGSGTAAIAATEVVPTNFKMHPVPLKSQDAPKVVGTPTPALTTSTSADLGLADNATGNRDVMTWQNVTATNNVLRLNFYAWVAGEYRVKLTAVKDSNCGIFDIAVNGVNSGSNPHDFYQATTGLADVDLGVFTLNSGLNEITFTSNGRNASNTNASNHYLYLDGLDIASGTITKYFQTAADFTLANSPAGITKSLDESNLAPALIQTGQLEGVGVTIWENPAPAGTANDSPTNNELRYTFDVAAAGNYLVSLSTVFADDMGMFDILVNNAPSTENPKDFYAINSSNNYNTFDLGVFALTATGNEIIFRSKGRNSLNDKTEPDGDLKQYLIIHKLSLAASTATPIPPTEPATPQRLTFLGQGTYPVGYDGLPGLDEKQLSDANLGPTGTGTEDVVAFWGNSTPDGAQLSYTLNVAEAGNYQVNLRAIKADDAGSFEISIAGTVHAAINPVDFFVPTNDPGTSPQTIDLGVYALAAGDNGIIFTSRGQNSSSAGYVLILDYLEVTATTAPVGPPASTTPTVETTLPAVPAAQRTAVETAIATAATGQTFSEAELITLLSESYWFHGIGVVADGQPIGSVSSWGLAATATAAGGARPTQQAAGMQFDGTDDYMTVGSTLVPATGDYQAHLALLPVSRTGDAHIYLSQFSGAEGRFHINSAGDLSEFGTFIGSAPGTNVSAVFPVSPAPTAMGILSSKHSGDDYTTGWNGAYLDPVVSKAGQTIEQVNTILGARGTGTTPPAAQFCQATISAVIVHPGKGDDTTELALRRFMNAFYGI